MVDGQLATVSGTIQPLREPLAAPFSHTPCVLCEYDIAGPQRVAAARAQDNSNSGSDYAGFLMVPCVIRTINGDVRLLGFPLVEGFEEAQCYSYTAARNARDFLRTTEFEDRTGLKMVSVLTVFGEIWADDDGLVQKNLRLGKVAVTDLFQPRFDQQLERLAQAEPEGIATQVTDEATDFDDDDPDATDDAGSDSEANDIEAGFETPKLVEKLVPVGTEVCAIGIYNEALGGLVPSGKSGPPNRLIRGTAEQIVNRSWKAIFRNFWGGFIGLLVIHGAILGVMAIYRNSPDVIRDQQHKATRAVTKSDLTALKAVVRRGVDVNCRDEDGRTLLMLAEQPDVSAWLIAQGADVNAIDSDGQTPLTYAARFGRTEIVRQLIGKKVELSPLSEETGQTPLTEAVSRGHEATGNVLREAGAK